MADYLLYLAHFLGYLFLCLSAGITCAFIYKFFHFKYMDKQSLSFINHHNFNKKRLI